MKIKHYFALAGCVLTLHAAAQAPVAQMALTGPDAAEQCAQAHLRAAARQPFTTVKHRQEMDRYDVKYYKLDLNLENTSRNVSGHVWIRARNGATALPALAFELYPSLVIDSVVVDKRRSPSQTRVEGDVTAQLATPVAANATFDARIYYHGTAPSGNSAAIGNALDTRFVTQYGVSVTWSLSEPFHAYEWFPCKQVLTDKADSSDVWISTSQLNKVGSNGVLTRVTPQPNGRHRYEWKSRYPIAYYLISVAVGPYQEYTTSAQVAGRPVPIVNYVYNQAALNNFKTEIDRTPGFIEGFSALVGDYPFAREKYGHSMAPIGGGMEHQTMTTQDGFYFGLTAHELFHQWFGNNVTCASWEDIWLNEGFASYGEYLARAQFNDAADALNWMNSAHKQVMSLPAGSVRVPDTTNVGRIFSSRLSYNKGAAVVHMLRYLLQDDEKFFQTLRTYQSTYAGSTARTADLQRLFEAAAGRNLDYFFQQWYAGEGFPIFNVEWKQQGNQLLIRTTETTSAPTITPFFQTELDYQITTSNGVQTIRLNQTSAVSEFKVAVSGDVTGLAVDPNQWVLNGLQAITRNDALVLAVRPGHAKMASIRTYPNPCRQELRLADLPAGTWQATITDALGRVVGQQELPAGVNRLTTATLQSGVYHLLLTSRQGLQQQARFVRE